MTSPARTRISPPTWGPVARSQPPRNSRARRRAGGALADAVGRSAGAARRAVASVGPDAIAGAVLLAGWTLLWVLFLLGILEPAAALRLAR